jgi:NhaC family Na+:H+ antiporter
MLSRLLRKGERLTQVFIPWSTTGVFIKATLGVSALKYAPFAILNYINPLLSILLAMFGLCILKENGDGETVEGK